MNYIHTVLELLSHPENQNFRWNCETWFCVEKFLEEATPQEAQALFEHMKAGRVGFSATYLNFCDLVDSQVLHRRREAQRRYALARRLEPQLGEKSPALCRAAEDNLLLYAEHTWGHSSTITNPYDTMVLNLDARKSSYASKAHEAASQLLGRTAAEKGDILHRIEAYNQRYPQGVQLRMVSLQELYSAIREPLADSPVYRGDLTDWWANGVGSTPYAVKHYREAQRRYGLARRLEPQLGEKSPALCRAAEDNLLLYAEHTWGHSSTITNPYDTMVLNLDARKSSYASKAHEAASQLLGRTAAEKGDILRYYNTSCPAPAWSTPCPTTAWRTCAPRAAPLSPRTMCPCSTLGRWPTIPSACATTGRRTTAARCAPG